MSAQGNDAQDIPGIIVGEAVRLYTSTDISADSLLDIEHSEPPVLAERKWRTHAVELIHKLSHDVLDSTLVSPILNDIASVITSAFPISFAAIEVYESSQVTFTASSLNKNIELDKTVHPVAPLSNTLAGEVVRRKSTLILSDALKNKYIVCPTLAQPFSVYHYIGVPLSIDNEIQGVLSIATTHNIVLDKETVTWAETIAHHISALLTREYVSKKLENQAQMTANMLNALTSPTIMCTNDGSIQNYNSAFKDMAEEFLKRNIDVTQENIFTLLDNTNKSNSYIKELNKCIKALFDGNNSHLRLDVLLTRSGYHHWYLVTMSILPDDKSVMIMFVDISDRKMAEEKLEHEMSHDQSTGLANRFLFHEYLTKTYLENQENNTSTCVFALDINRYGFIVESLGHDAADETIRKAAQRIENVMNHTDIIARVGAHEFAILIDHIHDANTARDFALNIADLFRTSFMIEEQELFLSPSIGIAITDPTKATDTDMILHDAHTAMTQARDDSNQTYAFSSVSTSSEAYKKLTKEKELYNAIENGEIEVFYQPEYSLETGNIIGGEALARWQHPIQGMITPDEFIGLAEESGLIDALFDHVLKTVTQHATTLYAQGHHKPLWINLSAKQISLNNTVKNIADYVYKSSLPPYMFGIELTESAAMENVQDAVSTMTKLKELGLSLALDDFGTGYSSLAYLQKFPVDLLKIDREFVAQLGRTSSSHEIVSAVIGMAHGLKIKVLAEGVETAYQVEILKSMDCDRAQGYFFAHPRAFQPFLEVLNF